jgi:type I restriction enzyme, S subunit
MAVMEQWPEVRIGDLGGVFTGRTPSTDRPSYFGDEFPFITPGDMHQGKYALETGRSLSDEGAELLKRIRVPAEAVCVSCIGWQMGNAIMTDRPSFTNQQINTIVPNGKVDPSFLFYSLLPRKEELLSLGSATGVRTPILNKSAFSNLTVKLPPLPVQRRIAGILSAYDELIENNQRRIRILEAMARALYREWFVHFRFPGREDRPRVPSPLGEIPEGWEVKQVPDCVHINPRIRLSRESEDPFVPMGCLSNDSMLITGIESRAGNSGSKFQNGDTLFARITPCLENGKTGFVQFLPSEDAVARGSTEFIVLRSNTLTPEFVYCLARSDEFRAVAIKSMTGASGRQRVQQQCFGDLKIVQPSRALIGQFSGIVEPSFRLIYHLNQQIQTLRRTRDLLLPRLLSGQLKLEVA